MELKAKEGDVISWEYSEIEYTAEVQIVRENGDYGVYVVYEGMSYTQDYIPNSDVLRVWKSE